MSIDGGSLVARCSCWWTGTALHDGRHVGVIGHYAAADEDSARALLSRACGLLASSGAATVVGPMDGTTWRRYRFIVDRGVEPPFFLEPDNPDEWPGHWARAGFAPLATYTSALNDNLDFEDPRTGATLDRLREAGITIRTLDPARADAELQRIFRLSLSAFSRNFLYTPIAEAEFLEQYHAVLPHVRPELVLLAEKEDALVGFMFAIPDLAAGASRRADRHGHPQDHRGRSGRERHGSRRRADGPRAAQRARPGLSARDPRVDARDERLADDQRPLRADDQALRALFETQL